MAVCLLCLIKYDHSQCDSQINTSRWKNRENSSLSSEKKIRAELEDTTNKLLIM